MSAIHVRLTDLRHQLGLSQEEVAGMVGISQRQISRYESGQNDPTADVLISFAKSFHTTTDWLLGLSD